MRTQEQLVQMQHDFQVKNMKTQLDEYINRLLSKKKCLELTLDDMRLAVESLGIPGMNQFLTTTIIIDTTINCFEDLEKIETRINAANKAKKFLNGTNNEYLKG